MVRPLPERPMSAMSWPPFTASPSPTCSLSLWGVGTQDSAVVLDDDELSVADEPAARVDDSPARSGPDRLLE